MSWFDRTSSADDEQLSTYMSKVAELPLPKSARMPDVDLLWVKAQMLRRWEVERRVQAPLDLMEPVQIAAGLVAAGVLLVWSLPSLLKVF